MKQRSSHSCSDSDQFFLAGEHLHLPCPREFRQIHRTSITDERNTGFTCGDGWHSRQQLPGMNKKFIQRLKFDNRRESLQAESVSQREFRDCGPAQGGQVGAAPEPLTQIMCNRPHVGAGSNVGAERGVIAFTRGDLKVLYLDLNRLELHLFMFASQLVSRNSMDLFR